MYVAFIDIDGESGTVDSELAVEYEGAWKAEIEEYVSTVATESVEEPGEIDTTRILEELVAAMPQELPILGAELQREYSSAHGDEDQ